MFACLFGSAAATHTPQEVATLLAAGKITLVDVRELAEWQGGHIKGARHIALSALPRAAGTLPVGRPVVFYCRSGARSGSAVALCRKLGLGHDTHMAGGIMAWSREGLPVSR